MHVESLVGGGIQMIPSGFVSKLGTPKKPMVHHHFMFQPLNIANAVQWGAQFGDKSRERDIKVLEVLEVHFKLLS